jgi:hypothetical protein
MKTPTRRDFTKFALAALPLAAAAKTIDSEAIDSKINGVQLGVQSYSFRDLPIDQAIQAMAADGLGDCELFSPHIEAGGIKAIRPLLAHYETMSAEERKAAFDAYNEKAQKWRLTVPFDYFTGVRKKFNDAGIQLYAYESQNQAY